MLHHHPTASPFPPSLTLRPLVRTLLGNAGRMTLLWVGFGVAVGLLTAPAPRGTVRLVAQAIAGVIVLSPLGAVVGLMGARRRDALVMALLGTGAGAALGAATDVPELGHTAGVGLIMGALFGTTFVAFFYRLPRLLLGVLSTRG